MEDKESANKYYGYDYYGKIYYKYFASNFTHGKKQRKKRGKEDALYNFESCILKSLSPKRFFKPLIKRFGRKTEILRSVYLYTMCGSDRSYFCGMNNVAV